MAQKKSAMKPNNKSSIVPTWCILSTGIFFVDKDLHENKRKARVNDLVNNNILSSFLNTSYISAQVKNP